MRARVGPSVHQVLAAQIRVGSQQIARDWWELQKGDFQVYISQLVLDEARAGDALAAGQRLRVLQPLPVLDITPEVAELTSDLLASGKIPRKAATDAAHIAIAAVHGMDFLLTCNCAHCQCRHGQSNRIDLPAARVRMPGHPYA